MGTEQRITAFVAPAMDELGLRLYDLEHTGGVLRVLVDKDGGVDVGSITAATRAISRLLDEHDPIPSRYTLEVSSPGLERTLRTPAHFEGAVGELVKVKTSTDIDGQRRFEGALTATDPQGFTIEVDGHARRIPYSGLDRARTVFEWGPTPRPGGPAPDPSRNRAKKAAAS